MEQFVKFGLPGKEAAASSGLFLFGQSAYLCALLFVRLLEGKQETLFGLGDCLKMHKDAKHKDGVAEGDQPAGVGQQRFCWPEGNGQKMEHTHCAEIFKKVSLNPILSALIQVSLKDRVLRPMSCPLKFKRLVNGFGFMVKMQI